MKLGGGDIKFGGPMIEKCGGSELLKNGGPSVEAMKNGGATPK
ncbi:hypothetical protein [Candidatus Ruminimicrobiellum ovillum]